MHKFLCNILKQTNKKNEKINSSPHFTKYSTSDEKQNEVADFKTSPYADGITKDYLKHIKDEIEK